MGLLPCRLMPVIVNPARRQGRSACRLVTATELADYPGCMSYPSLNPPGGRTRCVGAATSGLGGWPSKPHSAASTPDRKQLAHSQVRAACLLPKKAGRADQMNLPGRSPFRLPLRASNRLVAQPRRPCGCICQAANLSRTLISGPISTPRRPPQAEDALPGWLCSALAVSQKIRRA